MEQAWLSLEEFRERHTYFQPAFTKKMASPCFLIAANRPEADFESHAGARDTSLAIPPEDN